MPTLIDVPVEGDDSEERMTYDESMGNKSQKSATMTKAQIAAKKSQKSATKTMTQIAAKKPMGTVSDPPANSFTATTKSLALGVDTKQPAESAVRNNIESSVELEEPTPANVPSATTVKREGGELAEDAERGRDRSHPETIFSFLSKLEESVGGEIIADENICSRLDRLEQMVFVRGISPGGVAIQKRIIDLANFLGFKLPETLRG